MALGELEALSLESDHRVREVLLRLLEHKKEISKELEREDLSPLKARELRSLLDEVDSQVQQFRFSGTF